MKFLLFGTGDYYERYKKWFPKEDVLSLLDNSLEKQNTRMNGIQVLSPEEGIKLPFDSIVILSFYVKEMYAQLIRLGVLENRIYHFYDLHRLIYRRENKKPIQYYGEAGKITASKNRLSEKILLLSHDLTLGGPPIALFHAAKILMEHGYRVVYASMLDGPLRAQLLASHIPVIVDVNLQIETMRDADWISGFSLIICNTINFHVFLSKRNANVPAIWWLHDASFFYHGVDPKVLNRISRANLKVCSVGPIPRRAIQGYLPTLSVEDLLYAVADQSGAAKVMENKHDKICFVTIGYVGKIKGHDILIQAIQSLTENIREKVVFYFVGQNSSVMARQLAGKAVDMPEIVMTGTVGRNRIHQILDTADVLICPSREDSMPTVAAEAMMHSVPCIVSDSTGTAGYIKNGVEGFIFPSEDVQALANQITWCVEHRPDLGPMGEKARIVYEKFFSMNAFQERLIKMVEKCLK